MSKYTVKLSQYGEREISINGLGLEDAMELAETIVARSSNYVQVSLEREWESEESDKDQGDVDDAKVNVVLMMDEDAAKLLSALEV